MLIWNGLGFLVAVIGFGSLLLTEIVSERITGDDEFYQQNGWVIFIGMLVAAGLTYILHRVLQRQKQRVLVDKATGEEVVLSPDHSLFFVPVKWWPGVFIVLGMVLALAGPKMAAKPGADANGNAVAGQQ